MGNNINTIGTTTTNQQDLQVKDLAPNNYLTIVWKDVSMSDLIKELNIDENQALAYTNEINNAIDAGIRNNNVTYAGQNKFINVESIAKYISQNTIPAGTKRTVVNAIIGVATGLNQPNKDAVVNTCLNVFGGIAEKTARKLGYTDPHNIFSQVAGENVINVLGELGKNTKVFLDKCKARVNGKDKTNLTSKNGNKKNAKQYVGLLLGLTTSDTESYDITIPRKKVEDGSDYTTHLLPQPFKKEFSVKLTNKILTQDFNQSTEINAIEYTKNKLIEIAQSRTLFDIYIRLNAEKMYKRSNVAFSSLSLTKDEESGNGYTATFTIEPVNNFNTKTFVSNVKYGGSRGKGNASRGSKGRGKGSSKGKTADGGPIVVAYHKLKDMKDVTMKSKEQLYQYARTSENGKYTTIEIQDGNPKYGLVNKLEETRIYKGVKILKQDVEEIPICLTPGILNPLGPTHIIDPVKMPFTKVIVPKRGVVIDFKKKTVTSNNSTYFIGGEEKK